jgi:hypothetical protein
MNCHHLLILISEASDDRFPLIRFGQRRAQRRTRPLMDAVPVATREVESTVMVLASFVPSRLATAAAASVEGLLFGCGGHLPRESQ